MEANWHCDNYGIDTITTATIMAFLMECFQRGFLAREDTDGLELTWGSEELAYLDVVPTVMSMLGQIRALKPQQGSLFLVLSELFNNALDHGLLGLDSALKGQPNGFEQYLQLREERLASLSSGRIDMSFHLYMDEDRVTLDLTLSDSGPGFDYASLLPRQVGADDLAPHGRGIALVRSLCRELIYSGSGNRVLARLTI